MIKLLGFRAINKKKKIMEKIEFKQTLFLKKLQVDEKLLKEIEKIKLDRYGKSKNNYMRLDDETKQKGPFFFSYLEKFIQEICAELNKKKFFIRTFRSRSCN